HPPRSPLFPYTTLFRSTGATPSAPCASVSAKASPSSSNAPDLLPPSRGPCLNAWDGLIFSGTKSCSKQVRRMPNSRYPQPERKRSEERRVGKEGRREEV